MTEERKQELKSTFRSKYYNAVADCCFDVLQPTIVNKSVEDKLLADEYKEIVEDAHEWFMIHFFEE